MDKQKIKDGLSTILSYSKKGVSLVVVIATAIASIAKVMEQVNPTNEYGYVGIADYDDAIRAINRSGMWSTDKAAAIASVKRNESPEYYGAIISTAKSGMWSTDKVSAIKSLNVEKEE